MAFFLVIAKVTFKVLTKPCEVKCTRSHKN